MIRELFTWTVKILLFTKTLYCTCSHGFNQTHTIQSVRVYEITTFIHVHTYTCMYMYMCMCLNP